jgi:hypothetical protein
MRLVSFGVLLAGAAFALSVLAGGQAAKRIAAVDFPGCKPIRLSSPDRRWVLISDSVALNCPGQHEGNEAQSASDEDSPLRFYLTDRRTHRTRRVDVSGYGGSVQWATDSSAFFVNEHVASNEGEACFYQTSKLHKLDLREAILRADPSMEKFMDGHSYVWARQWLSNDTALVQLCGHSDEAPVVQFDVRYQVSLDGTVRKLSQQEGPPDLHECAWSEAR